jgi:hypothetical protein
MDNIVGKEENLEKRYIGHPVFGWNLSQRVVVEKFPDVLLDSGSLGIKPPHSPGMSLQIGDQDMIGIFLIFEKGQLLGFDGVFGNRTSHYNEPMNLFPTVGLVSKLSHLPSVAKFFEPTRSGSKFDGRIFLGDNRIAIGFLIEPFDHLLLEESRIGPEPDTRSWDSFGNFG